MAENNKTTAIDEVAHNEHMLTQIPRTCTIYNLSIRTRG